MLCFFFGVGGLVSNRGTAKDLPRISVKATRLWLA